MNKKLIILGLLLMTNLISSMDFSSLGQREGYNTAARKNFIARLGIEDCHNNKEAIIGEFFLQIQMNNTDIISHFLNLGVTPDLINNSGDTALIVAIQYDAQAVVQLLLDAGADPLQLVEHLPGQWMSLKEYVELYHSDYSELFDQYIRIVSQRYAPSAPPMEDNGDNFVRISSGNDRAFSVKSAQAEVEQQIIQANPSFISKLKSLVERNKLISGMTIAIIVGVAYKYLYKKDEKKIG